MTKIAHRWSPILTEVNRKRKQADQFKARLAVEIPAHGIATCIKENPHGFVVGQRYAFNRERGGDYSRQINRIHVYGDRHHNIWDWIFFDNDIDFHTHFTII